MSSQLEKNMNEHDRIWNAAIEAAAKVSEIENVPQFWVTEQIRKLKK